jgi:hypothetical protein
VFSYSAAAKTLRPGFRLAVLLLAVGCAAVGASSAKAPKYCEPESGAADQDQDGAPDHCDNCPLAWNPSQADVDADTQGNDCDLDDSIVLMRFVDHDTITWQSESGFDGWNWYRGDMRVLRQTGQYTQSGGSVAQRTCGLSQTTRNDSHEPTPGNVTFYVVSGSKGAVEGGLGRDGEGVVRRMHMSCKPTIVAIGGLDAPPIRPTSGGSCEFEVDDWGASFHNLVTWNSQIRDVIVERAEVTYTWDDPDLGVQQVEMNLGNVVVPPGGNSTVTFSPIDADDLGPEAEGAVASVHIEFDGHTELGQPITVVSGSSLSVPSCQVEACTLPAGVPCFFPDSLGGDPSAVSITGGDAGGNRIDLLVRVQGVPTRVYGAAFRVEYDPDVLAFESWEAGPLLGNSGQSTIYLVSPPPHDGALTVGATRLGAVQGAMANLPSGQTLMLLTFRARRPGTSHVRLLDVDLFDAGADPIPAIDWAGGRVVVN